MRAKIVAHLLGAALSVSSASLRAAETTGAEAVQLGAYTTSNWRSDAFKGTAYRQWSPAADAFCFVWDTQGGDQIGRIGINYGSPHLGAKIDDLKPGTTMATQAAYTQKVYGWFYWTIYGWTHRIYTDWGHTPTGWDNEFYVVMYTDKTREAFLADKGCVDIGSVDVDGVIYDCYNVPRAAQSQWLAVRRSKTWSASVDLRKISQYWRSKGLPNDYVVDLGWALEGFSGSAGKVQLTDVKIPNLAATAPAGAPSPSGTR